MNAKTTKMFKQSKNLKILLEMFAFLAATPLLMRFYSLDQFLSLITPSPKRHCNSNSQSTSSRINQLGSFLLKRDCLFLKKTCLKRSLLLYYFLRKNGIEVQIHFGVKKCGSYLAGHSWLTLKGNLFMDKKRVAVAFTPIISYPKHIEPSSN